MSYTPPPPLTVRELIKLLEQKVHHNPDIYDYEVWAADDCSRACDTPAYSISVDPDERRLTVGG